MYVYGHDLRFITLHIHGALSVVRQSDKGDGGKVDLMDRVNTRLYIITFFK